MAEENEISTFLVKIKSLLNEGKFKDILLLVETVNNYFDARSNAEIDYAIEQLFESRNNLTKFLQKTLSNKPFTKCNQEIFDLIRKLIKNYPDKIRPYSKVIVPICCKYIEAVPPSAKEKEQSVQIIQDLFIHKAIFDVDISLLLKEILAVLNFKTLSCKFLQHTYELLGIISERFPLEFSAAEAVKLRLDLINAIEALYTDSRVSAKEVSMYVIAGAVDGLNSHLINFPPDADTEKSLLLQLYTCMKNLSNPEKFEKRERHAFRKMLGLVAQHGYLVEEFLFQDYKFWHQMLNKWMLLTIYEDKRCGIIAVYTFHKAVANHIELRNNDGDTNILLFFIEDFKNILKSAESQPHKIRIAIRGFGVMAGSCKVLLPKNYLTELFDLVMQRTEHSYFTNDRLKRREVLEHLPNYVEALSMILEHINEISGIQLTSLQNIIIILIKDFNYLSRLHHPLVVKSLLGTFKNLQKLGGKIFDGSLEVIIMQGIVWTCSHQSTYDLEAEGENIRDWKDTITYKSYLPLWNGLLESKDLEISKILFNQFLNSIFLIIDRLNLGTTKRKYQDADGIDKEFSFSDPGIDLEPVKPKDYLIYYNLVSFCCDCLKAKPKEWLEINFNDWIELYLEIMIQHSFRHPLVSGFLKLIVSGLHIVKELNYLNEENAELKSKLLDQLTYLIKNVLIKIHQTSGELQIALLRCVFSAPVIVLKDFLSSLPEIFVIGFNVGKNILWLANLAFTCFEMVVASAPAKTRLKLLKNVLPCLDSYLQSKEANESQLQLKKLDTKSRSARQQIVYQESGDSELFRFQKRVVLFLGACDPDECLNILPPSDSIQLVREQITKVFKLKLECSDLLNPEIELDHIIPRLCILATSCPDRALRISACELVHALVLFKLGNDKIKADENLWRHLCLIMISLGSDDDLTIRQMFEPLLMQIMHYFSQPSKILTPLTPIIFECLLVSISHPKNPNVRDLAARLLREFLIWLFKQTTPQERVASPVKLVDLFHELKKMSINIDQSKRIGATLAFNNIYRIIREEQSLIDVYWFYLFDIFCVNFKMSEDLNEDFDYIFYNSRKFEQICASLDHLSRVLIERKDLFNRSNNNRIKPIEMNGVDLRSLVFWLFKQTGSKQYNYRHKCQQLFLKISPAVVGFMDAESFVHQITDVKEMISIGEALGIGLYADLSHIRNRKSSQLKEMEAWFEWFLTSLDFYTWIFSNKLASPAKIAEIFKQSKISQVITYYFQEIISTSPGEILSKINESNPSMTEHTFEIHTANMHLEQIINIKPILILKLLEFLTILLPYKILDSFLLQNQYDLIKLIYELIFKPHYYGFDYKCKKIVIDLPRHLQSLLEQLMLHGPVIFKTYLVEKLADELIKSLQEIINSCESALATNEISTKVQNTLQGVKMMTKKFTVFSSSFDKRQNDVIKSSANVLLKRLSNNLVEQQEDGLRPKYLKPNAKTFAGSAIAACFHIDDFLKISIDLSLNSDELSIVASNSITHGDHFTETFKQQLFEYFTSRVEESVSIIVEEISANNCLLIMKILADLNVYIFKNKRQNVKLLHEVSRVMLEKWDKVLKVTANIDNTMNVMDLGLVELATNLALNYPFDLYLLGQQLRGFNDWLLNLINNKNNSLEIKSKGILLLPCLTHIADKVNPELASCLLKLQEKFPLDSSKLRADSLEKAGLVTVLKAVFDALIVSKSPILLKFLVESTAADGNHILDWNIRETLADYIQGQDEKQQLEAIEFTFDMFLDETKRTLDPFVRLTIVNRFIIPLLKSSRIESALRFLRKKCAKLNILIDSTYTISDTWSSYRAEQGLANRCGGYLLIETLIAIIPKSRLFAFMPSVDKEDTKELEKEKKEVIKMFIKKATDARNDSFKKTPGDDVCALLYRQYQCFAYRALCALVTNTREREEIRLYCTCLFREVPDNDKYIWRKIVDIENDALYSNLTQDFDVEPGIKEYIVSVKQSLATMSTPETKKVDKRYIQTLSIFESSLSQSLTKNDLNYSIVYSQKFQQERELQRNQEKQQTITIALEKTAINQHETMSVLVAVINHMYHNIIKSSQLAAGSIEFVNCLKSSMLHPKQHKNVRLFLAKLVDNCREIFCNFANYFMEPILKLIVDKCAGEKINFFITDLVAMLLSWSHKHKPTGLVETSLAESLLKFLLENAYNERRDIFKLNLELIKKMMEVWNEVLYVPNGDLRTALMDSSELPRMICGIQLNAIVLANNKTPWTISSRDDYLNDVVRCCHHEKAAIYQPAAQLLGMCLAFIFKDQVEEDDKFLEKLNEKLQKLQRSNTIKFLYVLYGIHKYFPNISDNFLTSISLDISNAIGKVKCIYLEIFLSRLEKFDNLFRELQAIGIKNLLRHKDYQLLALHVVNKTLETLKAREIQELLPEICAFSTSSRNDCRQLMYEMLIFIVERFKDDQPSTVRKQALRNVLKGLSDSHQEIQQRVLNFFASNETLTQNFTERFLALLRDLYDPSLEKEFLNYAAQLLLEIPRMHPRSKRELMKDSVRRDLVFNEYEISTKSSLHSIPPMFVESQQKQLLAGDGSQMQFLRATQDDLQIFEPTQDPVKTSQVSQNFSLTQTQNSIIFSLQPQYLNRRSYRSEKSESNEESLEEGVVKKKENTKNIMSAFDKTFRTRFIRDRNKMSREQALRAVDEREYKALKSKNDKSRDKNVVLYRRYRSGDFPDFFINSLAILMPLQALARKDQHIAKIVFTIVYEALIANFKEDSIGSEANFYASINSSIANILQSNKSSEPFLFGTLIELVLKSEKYLEISPDVVAINATTNNMMVTGILFLENQLNHILASEHAYPESCEQGEPPQSKRGRTDKNATNHWLKLTDLYHSLSEFEIISGIFTEKLLLSPELNDAIELEANSSCLEAMTIYSKLVQQKAMGDQERDFYYQSYFHCLAQLGDWEEVTTQIQKQEENYESLWNDQFNVDVLLPNLIHGELRQILAGNGEREFLDVLAGWLRSPEKSEYLRLNFGEDLTMLYIIENEFKACRVVAENSLKQFTFQWNTFDSLTEKLRVGKLLNARNIAEMLNFSFCIDDSSSSKVKHLHRLLTNWTFSQPKVSDSLILWTTITAYRKHMHHILSEQQVDPRYLKALSDSLLQLDLNLLEVSFAQNNMTVSSLLLRDVKSSLRNKFADNMSSSLKLQVAKNKYKRLLAERAETIEEKTQEMTKVWESLNVRMESIRELDQFQESKTEICKEVSHISYSIYKLLPSFEGHFSEKNVIAELCRLMSSENSDNVRDQLMNYSFGKLEQAKNFALNSIMENSLDEESLETIGSVYLKLGQFCYELLENEKIEAILKFEEQMIISIFRSISYNNQEARLYIPYILQLPDLKNNVLKNIFNEELIPLPEWMFLSYVSQILSNFNFEDDSYLDNLIHKLALKYPNGLYFPFKLSYEHYKRSSNREMQKELIQLLDSIISNPLLDNFSRSMMSLCVPANMIYIHAKNLYHDMMEDEIRTEHQFQDKLKHMHLVLFENDMLGDEFKRIEKYKETLSRLMTLNLISQKMLIKTEMKKLVNDLDKTLKAYRETSIELHRLCFWLSDYKWCGNQEFLELPGQYTGESKPNVEQHVKIVRFESKLKIFVSKQKPIEIRILGSDGKTYRNIIKHGEDLRQDQRIQQILKLMSDKLALDKKCKQNKLVVQTYQVTPLNQFCGMLSVIEDTTTVREFLQDFTRNHLGWQPDLDIILNDIRKEYKYFLLQAVEDAPKNKPSHEIYWDAAITYSPQTMVEKFKEMESRIPHDVLKCALQHISVSLETFYILRKNFINSLASMNITNYILGIGDRHLSNILFDKKNGYLIGIDFGVAFGNATRNLPIPELIPFRLTPHFVNVLEPMGVSGLIKKNMTHTLRCLRNFSNTIVISLGMFIKEPTLDWVTESRRIFIGDDDEDHTAFPSSLVKDWNPETRIMIASRKLSGYNPAKLTEDELSVGQVCIDKTYLHAYLKILKGSDNLRSNLPESGLTIEQQVNCLIEIATDPYILASTYLGLDPWM